MMETANVPISFIYEGKRTSFFIIPILILMLDDIQAQSILTIRLPIEVKYTIVISCKEGFHESFFLVYYPLDKIYFSLKFLALKLSILLFTPKGKQCDVVLILMLFLIPFFSCLCIFKSFCFCVIEQFIIIHNIQ